MASAFPFGVSLELAQGAAHGRGTPAFASALKASESALADLIQARPGLELFSNVERKDDIEAAEKVAEALKQNTSALFVLGIGGSSLGGQALKDLAVSPKTEVLFFDNP